MWLHPAQAGAISEFASRVSRSVPSFLRSKNAIDFKLIAGKR
jgi:hypothetical protein